MVIIAIIVKKKLEMQKEAESLASQNDTKSKTTKNSSNIKQTTKETTKPKNTQVASAMSNEKLTMMVQRCEATIAMFEAELKGLEFQMNDPSLQADPQKSHEIATAYAQKEQDLEEQYLKWEQLTDELARKN